MENACGGGEGAILAFVVIKCLSEEEKFELEVKGKERTTGFGA